MIDTFYPSSPQELPKKLTSLPSSYQFRASLAILAIILFFVLYTILVVGLGYLVYYAFTYDMGRINKFTILMKAGAVAGALMLFVFTLKFIFKLKNVKSKNRIKLSKKDYPELWDFVYKICKETGAPKPKHIYADPDVNAYVSYTNMWLSLFLPVKKELTIGLGLVSCLNLSEFKAVISHEFGHFAQRSMKIGSYIISANTIIHDMIFSRDKWDNLLDQWRASDIRLSAAAWIITPIIWVIRQVLALFYQFLNVMYSSLSREMEFNADKVAISTSGSEAIISGLWKLDPGYTSWNSILNHAYMASQKKQFVKNLYTHNNLSLERNAETLNEQFNNLPVDERGGKTFFSSSEHSKVNMYASHPPNDKRQDNAKIPFVDCKIDERSPWLLFSNNAQLQEKMTALIYEQYLAKQPEEHISEQAFESFIISENQGKDLLTDYDNTFENRFLNIPTDEELEHKSETSTLTKAAISKMKTELNVLMKPVKSIEELMLKAGQIAEGTTKENAFSFKGQTYKKKNIQEGYMELHNEREALFNDTFKNWDLSFCSFYYALAKTVDSHDNLKKLYQQHANLTHIYKAAVACKNRIFTELNNLQSQEVSEHQVTSFGRDVNGYIMGLNDELERLNAANFVELPNIDTIEELKEAIVDNGAFNRESGQIFENGGFDRLLNTLETAIQHCQRIDQKSIGVILSEHKALETHLQ